VRSLFLRYTLFIYVFVTYLFSWAFLYPCYRILLNAPEGTFPWLALIGLPGAYGPSLVALFMTIYVITMVLLLLLGSALLLRRRGPQGRQG
jgi:hypothetical protein